MTAPRLFPLAAARSIGVLIVAFACVQESIPTGPELENRPAVSNPPISPPPPPPPSAPSPSSDNRRSFVWSEEAGFTILENPPGAILVAADGINATGEVVGTLIMAPSAGAPIYRGFRWSAARGFTYIIAPSGANTYLRGIDDQGNIVGYTERFALREAFSWKEAEGFRTLGIPVPNLHVLGIRDGVVFGNFASTQSSRPFRLRLNAGQVEQFTTVNAYGGGVMDANQRGEAVGYDGNIDHGFGGTSDAVFWDQTGNRTVAYDCKGEDDCFAHLVGVSSSGLAVGKVARSQMDDTKVFKWSRSAGLEYIDVPYARWQGIDVAGITDDGSILAHNGANGFVFKPSGAVTVIRPPSTHQVVQTRAMNRNGQVIGMLF